MRRFMVGLVMLLAGSLTSCMPVNNPAFLDTRGGQVQPRPAPPNPPAWHNLSTPAGPPNDPSAAAVTAAKGAADPMPNTLNNRLPTNPQVVPNPPEAYLTAYATGQSSGYGPIPAAATVQPVGKQIQGTVQTTVAKDQLASAVVGLNSSDSARTNDQAGASPTDQGTGVIQTGHMELQSPPMGGGISVEGGSRPKSASVASFPLMRVVSSKRIAFNYEVTDGAGATDTEVELWGTQDMKPWARFESTRPSADSQVIDAKEDGLYGFSLIAHRGSTPAVPPQRGDMPQVWILVDSTIPEVAIQGVEISLTEATPTLVVRWIAQDKNFLRRPITISHAENPAGPWIPMVSGVENTGRYEFSLTATMPHQMFLRVEAMDLAGNIGASSTPRLIKLELPWNPGTASAAAREDNSVPAPPALSGNTSGPAVMLTNVEAN